MGLFDKLRGGLLKAIGKVLEVIWPEPVRRWVPLLAGVLLVVAGGLRVAGQVTQAEFIENLLSTLGFQSEVSNTEVTALFGLGAGLITKFIAMWNKAKSGA
jgi:hypothetical protein